MAWLRDARLSSGKTAADFAAELGVSRTTLWRWETGKLAPPRWLPHAVAAVLANIPEKPSVSVGFATGAQGGRT